MRSRLLERLIRHKSDFCAERGELTQYKGRNRYHNNNTMSIYIFTTRHVQTRNLTGTALRHIAVHTGEKPQECPNHLSESLGTLEVV